MKQAMINYMQNPKCDEMFTPKYAVYPILKYLKPKSTIWCPFDQFDSNYVSLFKKYNFNVIYSHLNDNKDFFNFSPNTKIDYIISNPPYSIKDKVLTKLYELNIPFAMLLPLTALEGIYRSKLFQNYGLELLVFDKRTNFLIEKKSNWFNTSYFCHKVLPDKLIFHTLDKKYSEAERRQENEC